MELMFVDQGLQQLTRSLLRSSVSKRTLIVLTRRGQRIGALRVEFEPLKLRLLTAFLRFRHVKSQDQ